ncbi:MAG: RadC family protein [Salibacteraceae bacterium]
MKPYQPKLSIKSWAEDDRPREKLIQKGRSILSDAELIAILIGSGNRELSAVELSKQILAKFDNNINEVSKKSVNDLMAFNGIGEAKAISIIAALELGRRRKEENLIVKSKITCSKDAYNILYPLLADKPVEEFWLLLLNQNNRVLSKHQISSGGISGTVADVRVILKKALDELSSGIILSHNHPSGNTLPSHADKKLTHKVIEAAKFMDLKVLDHIIIGDEDYYSFADSDILR